MGPTLNFEDYTVAWIAVLPIEAKAALGMLDSQHEGHFESARGDDYIYLGGSINGHNVVIATWPEGQNYGVGSAAALVNQVKSRFPNIWFALLVGVAAGLPNLSPKPPTKKRDIRLGDVLVCVPGQASHGIVQYDLGRDTEEGFVTNNRHAETPAIVRSAISNIKLTKPKPFKTGNIFAGYLATFLDNTEDEDEHFSYPGQHEDRLLTDVREDSVTPTFVERLARDETERTRVWYGNIGSGNSLMRDPCRRDELRDKYDLIGLEMEAAGVMNTLPTGVIRGVCDYGDSQKNKIWQPYAAAVAAVYAKGILYTINPKETRAKKEHVKSLTVLPFGQNENFVGRQSFVDHLIKVFITDDNGRNCQRAALDGLGGVGKTQIALEFAFKIQELSPDHSVFWVQASDANTFDSSYRRIAKELKIPIEDDNADIKSLVRDKLSEPNTGKWLLIVDNADDFSMFYKAPHASTSTELSKYLPFSNNGGILFTTRDHKAATKFASTNVVNVSEMNDGESKNLLRKHLQRPELLDDTDSTRRLLQLLVNLPLAIVQAAAYLNSTSTTITRYLQIYDESAQDATKLLREGFEDQRRYPEMENAVATTWLVSFQQIQRQDLLAADYLKFIACIQEKDIPEDLLPDALLPEQTMALGTLKAFGFLKEHTNGRFYDMHRLVHLATRNWLKIENGISEWTWKALERLRAVIPYGGYSNTWRKATSTY
ncbi:hypothetical protein BP5796_05041 [Coleophoma crateriformis]|uniref:NB-ARC domain-containing protein n=1 Tax=Coleophoma crateriformis TaxID=565419 RepID=A0A3D8S213_9HELO|nr:hypothetical protein BP5796_05041 [Coleophoma crateriformis]